MNRFIFCIIIVLFFAQSVFAEHLKFEGIPIEGSITEFQNKLAIKGIKINTNRSNDLPAGQRAYDGKSLGYKAEIVVYYNRKTKDVYKVKAIVSFQKKEAAQNILKKTLGIIEQKYIYKVTRNFKGENLFFKYYILPSRGSAEHIGIIHVAPTSLFSKGDETWNFSSYAVVFEYEDVSNTSKLTPSTTEPKAWPFLTCGQPDNFKKFLIDAKNYRKNDCYESCINRLVSVLDYYKYGCAPEGMEEYEDVIEQNIINLQSCKICNIKTASDNDSVNVYLVLNDTTNTFKYITYSVIMKIYHVRLDVSCILKQIIVLEKLKDIYERKKNSIKEEKLSEYWKENIDLTMPIILGKDKSSKMGNDVDWKDSEFTMKFSLFNQELSVDVNINDDYTTILRFRNKEEINNYQNFLVNIIEKLINV